MQEVSARRQSASGVDRIPRRRRTSGDVPENRRLGADGQAEGREVGLGGGDRVVAEVEDAGGEGGVGAGGQTGGEVVEGADAAGGDHRDRDGGGDRGDQREVVAGAGAVAVHAG